MESALRWAHDAKRVLELPEEFTEPETEENLSKEANELLVCLLRGKNLPVMDKNLLSSGGSSDPCAFLNLDGEKRKSRVIKKNINPQWMQTFRFPCDDGLNVTLQCDIEDYDLKGNDFMGAYLRVLRCCGAFPSLDGLVAIARCRGWSRFRF